MTHKELLAEARAQLAYLGDDKHTNELVSQIDAALAQPEQEPVAFITPLMEQQMFDDWCPYKGNQDPRVVWAAAIDAVNGLLLGATTPPHRKPLTDDEFTTAIEVEGIPVEDVELVYAIKDIVEAAHGIK